MELDPLILNTFRAKIANPTYWGRVYRILMSCGAGDLATPYGAGVVVDNLADALELQMTPEQRAHAVKWLVAQRIDPRNPAHQLRMWRIVLGAS